MNRRMGNSGLNSLDDAEREGWIRAQKVAFTAWVNFQLEEFEGGQDSKGGEERRKVVDLYEDLKDGLVLLRLIRAVSGQTPSGKVTQKPRMKIQCTENIQFFMDILKKLSIRTENIGAEDIYSGNQNIILGLIYTLILRFGGVTRQSPSAVASGISASESLSSSSSKSSSSTPPSPSSSKDTSIDKNDLLEWCNTRCEAYGVHVDNFTSSWADGRGFSALTASLVAGFGYQEATTDPSASLGSSFEAIESGLRVPQMLVPELMVSPYSPDERSVITYLSAIRSKYGEAPLIAPVESEPEPEPEPLDFDVTGDGLRDGLAAIERRVRVKIAGDGASVEAAQLRVVDEDGNEVPVTAIRVDEHTVEFRYLATEEGTLRILGSYEGEALFEKTVTIEPAEASSFALEALQEVAKVGEPAEFRARISDAFHNQVSWQATSEISPLSVIVQSLDHPSDQIVATITHLDGDETRVSFVPIHAGPHEVALNWKDPSAPVAQTTVQAREETRNFEIFSLSLSAQTSSCVAQPTKLRVRQSVDGSPLCITADQLDKFKLQASSPVQDLSVTLDPSTGELELSFVPTEKGDLEIRLLYDGAPAAKTELLVAPSSPSQFFFEGPSEPPSVKDKCLFKVSAQDARSNFTDFDPSLVGLIITGPDGAKVPHSFEFADFHSCDVLDGSFTPLLAGDHSVQLYYDGVLVSTSFLTANPSSLSNFCLASDTVAPSTPVSSSSFSSSSSSSSKRRGHHRSAKKTKERKHKSRRHRKSTPVDETPTVSEATAAAVKDASSRKKVRLLRVYFGDCPVGILSGLKDNFKSFEFSNDTLASDVQERVFEHLKKLLSSDKHPELIKLLNVHRYCLSSMSDQGPRMIPPSSNISDTLEKMNASDADLKMRSALGRTGQAQPSISQLAQKDSVGDIKRALTNKSLTKFLLSQPRRIIITLEAGKDLPVKDSSGTSDPYCKLLLNTQKHQSSVVPCNLNPVWNQEQFEFGVRSAEDGDLYLEVWDHDKIGHHDFMGCFTLKMNDLVLDTPVTGWHSLTSRPGKAGLKDKVSGEIKITRLFTNAGTAGVSSSVLPGISGTPEASSSSSSKPAIKLSKKQRAALISQQPNRLTVTAVRGIGLIAKDTSGTSDPYITFEIFHQIQKTQRIDKTLDPVWNQTLTFMVPNLTEDISLNTTVWDWDAVGSHDFMGTVNIPLKSFLDSHAAIQGTYTLQSRPGKHDKVSGQIELRIEFLKGVNAEAETKIFFGPAPTIPIAVSSNYPPLKGKVGDKITIKIELRMVSTKALTDDMFGGELNCCFTNPDGSKTIVHASKNPNIVTHADRIKETGRFYIVFSPSAPGKVASLIRFNGEPMQRKEVTFTIAPGRSNVKIH